jgi:tetratricopeptide (TPR) repeat protein
MNEQELARLLAVAVRNDQAARLILANDYVAAAALLDDALAEHGEEAVLLFNRGLVFERTGDDGLAERAYRRALSLDPASCKTLVHLGNVLIRQERLDEAEQCYRLALDHDSRFFPALYSLAAVLERQGLRVPAHKAYSETTGLNPGYAEAWLGLARTANHAQARHDALRRALVCASSVEDLFKLGQIAARFEVLGTAAQALERVLALDADHVEARYTLAAVRWFTGDVDAALAQADQVARAAQASDDEDLLARCQRLQRDIRISTRQNNG